MIAYALCASFCTLSSSLGALEALCRAGEDVVPVISEKILAYDTRFGKGADFLKRAEEICSKRAVTSIAEAEKFGSITPLEYMIISPCTGNTLAKLANGITDSAVTMAAKAHLRCDRPLLISLASNDALSQNLKNVAALLSRKSVYFVPMLQDDPDGKPHSLVADPKIVPDAFSAMKKGKQLRPVFLAR